MTVEHQEADVGKRLEHIPVVKAIAETQHIVTMTVLSILVAVIAVVSTAMYYVCIMCIFASLNVVLAHLCSSPSCRGAQFKVKKQARITLYQHKSCQLRQRRLQLTKQR